MRLFLHLVVMLACWLPAALQAADDAVITITVGAEERQTFGGFGTSLGNWHGDYQKLAPADRAKLSEMMWRELKFKTLRLWLNIDEYSPTPGARDMSVFRRCYIESGIVADARRLGVTTLLLAPEGLAAYMKEAQPDGGRGLKQSELAGYVAVLADFLVQLKAETGVQIDVTGIQNEPNVSDRFTPEQMAESVRLLRAELDARGLGAVKIIAPEQANCDDGYYKQVEVLKKDVAAWRALAGVSSHSYNMAATDQAARLIAAPDGGNLKDYWMTEASDNGTEEPGDARRAASLAARFLNDVNHRVTHWIHFLGFEVSDPKDNATRIVAYTPEPFRPVIFQKYYAYQQLARAFDIGAIFHESRSDREAAMTWTYGKKPRLTAAAAHNPDGTWVIGLVNYTADTFLGVQGWGDDEWNDKQGGHTPAQTIVATLDLSALALPPGTTFEVQRTPASDTVDKPEIATLKEGKAGVTVRPLEVVTLRNRN